METQNWEMQNEGALWPSKNTKPGDFVEGKCIEIAAGKYNKMNYSIEQADGTVMIVKGTAYLIPRMVKVKVGTVVRLVFKAMENTGKGNDMYVFDVFIAKTPEKKSTLNLEEIAPPPTSQ